MGKLHRAASNLLLPSTAQVVEFLFFSLPTFDLLTLHREKWHFETHRLIHIPQLVRIC